MRVWLVILLTLGLGATLYLTGTFLFAWSQL